MPTRPQGKRIKERSAKSHKPPVTSGDPIFEKQAWVAALVLLAFVMFLNVGTRLLTGKRVVLASRTE